MKILKLSTIICMTAILTLLSFNNVEAKTENAYSKIAYSSSGNSQVDYACTDLERYLGQVTGNIPKTISLTKWKKSNQSAIVIGDLDLLNNFLPANQQVTDLGEEGFAIKKVDIKGKTSILLCANTPQGQKNAVYGLLKELNFEFLLGSEFIPSVLPDITSFTDELIIKKPVFAVRGVLPWYNFFNSPTSWNPIDHRTFVDQLVRSGANFITFHSYEHEPFVAVKENGKMIFGEGLNDTSKPTWGTNPMKTTEFLYGTDKFYDKEYFGAETTQSGYDRDTQIEKEKEVMRDALLYAKSRGLKTSIGFAPLGDPTNEADRERFIKEFTYNLEYYKALDYIFIWQTETKGAQGHPLKYDTHILPDARDPESKIINYGEYRREEFKRIVDREEGIKPFFKNTEEGKIARATEGARLEMFVKIALRILSRYDNPPKLAVSGWGGENYLLSEEYYDGLDKVLPKDVAFSSLESLTPKTYIDKAYFDLPADRQRWPIPWLENDGDQWQPQPFLKTYEPMIKDLQKSGSQGFLTIHWRTREVEDNFGYLLGYAWNEGLTKEQYFAKKAAKFGKFADDMKQIYIDLDDLGYRWVGGNGQVECGKFGWSAGTPEKAEKLKNIRTRLQKIIPQIEGNKENLVWLDNHIEWVLNYYVAEKAGEQVRDMLILARKSDERPQKELAQKAYEILSGDALANAMQSYTKRLTTRGEYGVLATVNSKAAYDWRKMYRESCRILGIDSTLNDAVEYAEGDIIVPKLYGSTQSGQPFTIDAIITGGSDAILKYRTVGSSRWEQIPMTEKGGWVKTASIPASDIKTPGIEFEIISANNTSSNYGPKTVTVNNAVNIANPLIFKNDRGEQKLTTIEINKERGFNVISWNELSDADYYIVSINGQKEVEAPVCFYPYEGKDVKSVEIKAMKKDGTLSVLKKEF